MPVHVGERSAESVLAEATGDRGADVAIDAVGAVEAYRSATTVVRRGGRVVVAGVYAGESVELQLGVAWARALDVRFTGRLPGAPALARGHASSWKPARSTRCRS